MRGGIPSQVAGNRYTATYTVQSGDDGDDLRVRAALESSGATTFVTFPNPIRIDTVAPTITTAEHDARQPLGIDKVLSVVVQSEPGLTGEFDLVRQDGSVARSRIALEESEDGRYAGAFTVTPSDLLADGRVRVAMTDAAGNRATKEITLPVTFDTVPPRVDSVTHDATTTLIDGESFAVTLTGEVGARGSFSIVQTDGTAFRADAPLFDDGANNDGDPNDGVYGGRYTVRAGDFVQNAQVVGRLTDDAGNATNASARNALSIDAAAPVIDSATHSATKPLRRDDTLVVRATGFIGATATFSLNRADGSAFRANLPLKDDGAGSDETANDGNYVGDYRVASGDDLQNGSVVVTLKKSNGKSVSRAVATPITLDTVAPDAVSGVAAGSCPSSGSRPARRTSRRTASSSRRVRWFPRKGYRLSVCCSPTSLSLASSFRRGRGRFSSLSRRSMSRGMCRRCGWGAAAPCRRRSRRLIT